MYLIADSGSTKTSWCMFDDKGSYGLPDTEGYNPYFVDSDYIARSLATGFNGRVDAKAVAGVYFYGSGVYPQTAHIVSDAIIRIFENAEVQVEMDLLAAARALLGSSPGFAAILGTGTNTCLYDGHTITQNIDSLGFILGDEGSGTALGKMLLGDYIRGYMPQQLKELFNAEFQLTLETIFEQVYHKPLANRFCASFGPFIARHIEQPYMTNLVNTCFRAFFTNLVSKYPHYEQYRFNCIGSVGYIFTSHLKQVALDFGMQPGIIVRSPLEGLIAYHTGLVKIQLP